MTGKAAPPDGLNDYLQLPASVTAIRKTISATSLSIVLCAVATIPGWAATGAVTWISSTNDQKWKEMPAPALVHADPEAPADVRVTPRRTYQTMEGFGGCFNELGWIALSKASAADRSAVLKSLFGDDGCAFNLARLPIGASDFSVDAYSLDDAPGDLALSRFSIERDRKQLIPFVKGAMEVRSSLKCWGSPWSPPAWMKTNNHYSKGSLKWEPAILRAYAAYLIRWIEAYRAAGINIYGLAPQNESNIASAYPSCLWTGEQLREFIADYLGPALRERKANVELWLGTLNGDPSNRGDNINYRAAAVLEDPKAGAFVTGITFQYDSRNLIGSAGELYPDKKLMQSETECNGGANSWADAQRLYQLMKHYIDGGAGSYFAWNMVLDETGMSTWKWKQNALITVDQANGKVAYNGEYFVMRHFSRFVKPGAKRVLATGVWGDKIAFANPDGSMVVVIGNSADKPLQHILTIGGRAGNDTLDVMLPAGSINTFVVAPAE